MRIKAGIGLLLLLTATCSQANDADGPTDAKRHRLQVGVTWQTADLEFSANRQPLPPVSISQDDVGLDDSYTSFMIDYQYRINSDWTLFMGAYRFSIDGATQIERDLNFNGAVYPVGSYVESTADIDVYIVDGLYTLHQSENMEIRVGAGLHAFDLRASLDGALTAGDQEGPFAEESEAFLAPLPNLRFQGEYALSERLNFELTLGWLSASYEDYSGDFRYANAQLHFAVTERLGISSGFQYTRVNVSEKRSNGKDKYDVDLYGPNVQVSYSF